MSILKRTTSQALAQTRAQLAALAVQVAETRRRREAALAGDDGVAAVTALDRQADDQGRRERALQDKISLLEGRLASEQDEQALRDYVAAVSKIDPPLARRLKGVEKIQRGVDLLAEGMREVCDAGPEVVASWPPGVPWPNVYHPAYLSEERIGRFVQETFTVPRGHADRRPAQPSEFVTLARNADRARWLIPTEREQQTQFREDMRSAHDPAPAEEAAA